MTQHASIALRAIAGAVGGLLYSGLLAFLGAMEGGAGHGSYFIESFTGAPVIGVFSIPFWIAYGSLLATCRPGFSSRLTLLFLMAPYICGFSLLMTGDLAGPVNGIFLFLCAIVFVSQLLIFNWWRRKSHGLS